MRAGKILSLFLCVSAKIKKKEARSQDEKPRKSFFPARSRARQRCLLLLLLKENARVVDTEQCVWSYMRVQWKLMMDPATIRISIHHISDRKCDEIPCYSLSLPLSLFSAFDCDQGSWNLALRSFIFNGEWVLNGVSVYNWLEWVMCCFMDVWSHLHTHSSMQLRPVKEQVFEMWL